MYSPWPITPGATIEYVQGDVPTESSDPLLAYFLLLPGWRLWWRDFNVRRRAKRDARTGNYRPDLITGEFLGARPTLDHNDPTMAGLHDKIETLREYIKQAKEHLTAVRDELTKHTSILLLRSGVTGAYLTEIAGCILVLRDVGLAPRERAILSVALAAFVFVITSVAAKASQESDKRRAWWFPAVIGAYALLVIALTIVRINAATNNDNTISNEVAMGVVMLFTTIGPALVAELLLQKLAPVAPLVRQKHELRKRLKTSQRELAASETKASTLAREARAWEGDAVRLHATYDSAYFAEEAKQRGNHRTPLQAVGGHHQPPVLDNHQANPPSVPRANGGIHMRT